MSIKTFVRNELKFIVGEKAYEHLCGVLHQHMCYDAFCPDGKHYPIYNLYFDTREDEVIQKSLQKPYYKEKLRLRSYRMPTKEDDTVFLELKKKIGGVVSKRRAVMHYDQALDFVNSGVIPRCEGYQDHQVLCEIADFISRYDVHPKAYIGYERVAFFGKDDPDLRISFDFDIVGRDSQLCLRQGHFGMALLPPGSCLMEVKCTGGMPLWLVHELSKLRIYTGGFSKYGTYYKKKHQAEIA